MSRTETAPSPIAATLGWVHLLYLGALPSFATFGVTYGHGFPRLPMAGADSLGVIAVAGFFIICALLAVLISQTRLPSSVWQAVLVLVDGPLVALLSMRSDPSVFDYATCAFVVDGVGISIAFAALASTTPTLRGLKRVPYIVVTLGILACFMLLFWPSVSHDLVTIASLGGGIVWTAIVDYRLLPGKAVPRSSRVTTAYIFGFLFLWLAAYITGNALHSHRPALAIGSHETMKLGA